VNRGITSDRIAESLSAKAEAEKDPERKEDLYSLYRAWVKGDDQEKRCLLKDVALGLGLIAVTPLALGAAALAGAGAIFYGTGKIIECTGRVLMKPGKKGMERLKAKKE
jgi:hypothetical protein